MNPLLTVFLPVAIAYATALRWCWDLWWLDDGYFAHQPLVPLVMALVFWLRRDQWRRRPAAVDPRGWWLLGPALLLHLCGAALTIDSLSAASMVLAVPGAAWLALGRERLRGQWPVLWMGALAVPLPMYATGRLAFELKEVAVRGGVWLAQGSGLEVLREGAYLHVPGQELPLNVADPCGGLRSLLAMMTLVYCIACFVGPARFWRRTLLLVAAGPVAVFVNLLRITAICWLARWYGVEFATGTGHDLLNTAAWIVDLAIVLTFDRLLSGSRAATAAAAIEPAPAIAGVPRRAGWWPWLACAPLLFLSLYRPEAPPTQRAANLPTVADEFVQERAYPMTERFFQLLGTRDATWRSYEGAEGIPLYVVAVFHGNNWKSVHPPHVCLQGSDMDVVEDGETMLGADGDQQIGRILLRGRSNGRQYLSLYAYAARGLCTGSYRSFFLHHAPRALFRASNDGFLLRVESYADGAGGVAAAERRCRDLLSALLRAGLEQLP